VSSSVLRPAMIAGIATGWLFGLAAGSINGWIVGFAWGGDVGVWPPFVVLAGLFGVGVIAVIFGCVRLALIRSSTTGRES